MDTSQGTGGEQGNGKGKWSREFGPFLTLGIQLALTVVIFFFAGRWLDDKLGTAPWLMLAGLALGISGGMIKFFRTVAALDGNSARKHED